MKFEIENVEIRRRVLEAVNYLLLKNKNFEYVDNKLYDKKNKIYYNCETGEIIKSFKKNKK